MQLATKVIEEVLWRDVFKNQTVIDYCKNFIIDIVVLRVISIFFEIKITESLVHFIKAFMYGVLVIMLVAYFAKDNNNIQNINIFTGFTFLFSVIEIIDNLTSILVDWVGTDLLNEKNKRTMKDKEINDFMDICMNLEQLQVLLKPGKISPQLKNAIWKLNEAKKKTHFSFYNIEKIIDEEDEQSICLKNSLYDIWMDETVQRIMEKIQNEEMGKVDSKVKITENDCKRIRKKISITIQLYMIYISNKRKLILERDKLKIVDYDS